LPFALALPAPPEGIAVATRECAGGAAPCSIAERAVP
jgi:hypothetical protein